MCLYLSVSPSSINLSYIPVKIKVSLSSIHFHQDSIYGFNEQTTKMFFSDSPLLSSIPLQPTASPFNFHLFYTTPLPPPPFQTTPMCHPYKAVTQPFARAWSALPSQIAVLRPVLVTSRLRDPRYDSTLSFMGPAPHFHTSTSPIAITGSCAPTARPEARR